MCLVVVAVEGMLVVRGGSASNSRGGSNSSSRRSRQWVGQVAAVHVFYFSWVVSVQCILF